MIPITEQEMRSLVARARAVRQDIGQWHPVDCPAWDEALARLDDAIDGLSAVCYLAAEWKADDDAVEVGNAKRLPAGDVVPVQEDPHR